MDVADCHEAVQKAVQELVNNRTCEIILHGYGYGALIATKLASSHPDIYRRMLLFSPLVDLTSIRHLGPLLPSLLGKNFTDGQIYEDGKLLRDAWTR